MKSKKLVSVLMGVAIASTTAFASASGCGANGCQSDKKDKKEGAQSKCAGDKKEHGK